MLSFVSLFGLSVQVGEFEENCQYHVLLRALQHCHLKFHARKVAGHLEIITGLLAALKIARSDSKSSQVLNEIRGVMYYDQFFIEQVTLSGVTRLSQALHMNYATAL